LALFEKVVVSVPIFTISNERNVIGVEYLEKKKFIVTVLKAV